MKIGLVIKLDEDQALGRAPRYSEIRTTALAAEEVRLRFHLALRPPALSLRRPNRRHLGMLDDAQRAG